MQILIHRYAYSLLFVIGIIFISHRVSAEVSKKVFVPGNSEFDNYCALSKRINKLSRYYNLTCVDYSRGLGNVSTSQSSGFLGISNVTGLRFRPEFWAGAGAGIIRSSDGVLIPVFLDTHYFFGKNRLHETKKNEMFLAGDGGFIFRFAGAQANTRFFLNPGMGMKFKLSSNSALFSSIGFWTQWQMSNQQILTNLRDSFVNLKVGLAFY